jgi:diacylglycerol kinase family enzyme
MGGIRSQRRVRSGHGRTVEIRTGGTTGFNVDGELVNAEDARFRVAAQAFRVVHG